MSRLIRNDEKEVYCTNCNCRIGYYPEDVYIIKNAFNSGVKDIRIKCPNKECGCSIFLGEISK